MSDWESRAVDVLAAEVRRLLEPIVAGRHVFLTGAAVNNAALRDLMLRAHAQSVHMLSLPVSDRSPIDRRVARIDRFLAHPPMRVRRTLDHVDPHGEALVYAGSYTAQRMVAGRRLIGARAATHFAAERKDRQRALLGLRHLARIELADVSATEALRSLARRQDIVVSGQPRSNLALGASHTYLLTPMTQRIDAIVRRLARDCDSAFVGPRHVGLPCTFYGFVDESGAIEFGPVEALVYWSRRTHRVHAIGIVRPFDRANVAFADQAARDAATRLAAKTGYRGAFCTDGVVTPKRYIIHEVNPRICAGFALLSSMAGGFPLSAVDLVLRERPGGGAGERLMRCLYDVREVLRVQRRMVKVWDDTHRSDAVISSVNKADDRAWLQSVRRMLGGNALRLMADGAELD